MFEWIQYKYISMNDCNIKQIKLYSYLSFKNSIKKSFENKQVL